MHLKSLLLVALLLTGRSLLAGDAAPPSRASTLLPEAPKPACCKPAPKPACCPATPAPAEAALPFTAESLYQLDVSFTDLARAFQYPEGYFYIERSMLLLLGLCVSLDYTLDPLIVGAPYAMQLILETAEPGSLVIPPPPAQA